MMQYQRLYIDGQWTTPIDPSEVELVDPTREETFARVTLGARLMQIARSPQPGTPSRLLHDVGRRAHLVDRSHHRCLRAVHR